ncbi:hypothetical protein ERJ75_000032900 [Trypanosoma vivax]|uniref:Uncharacterized protein n=1 Tax=Trypanosoma vivax (strain Y486) TaxID=1055687 RepID=G0U7Q0_TRYVY|nr:hypothetical protein TRVL_00449 [Trypanosoma vivax]KAH8620675.1 hypothetical protein ERJ75_000032900 [Trypanosoma vivax]CCC51908.1 hypothetical protein TVY486_1009530 [Trypanosoma vivax Y486]
MTFSNFYCARRRCGDCDSVVKHERTPSNANRQRSPQLFGRFVTATNGQVCVARSTCSAPRFTASSSPKVTHKKPRGRRISCGGQASLSRANSSFAPRSYFSSSRRGNNPGRDCKCPTPSNERLLPTPLTQCDIAHSKSKDLRYTGITPSSARYGQSVQRKRMHIVCLSPRDRSLDKEEGFAALKRFERSSLVLGSQSPCPRSPLALSDSPCRGRSNSSDAPYFCGMLPNDFHILHEPSHLTCALSDTVEAQSHLFVSGDNALRDMEFALTVSSLSRLMDTPPKILKAPKHSSPPQENPSCSTAALANYESVVSRTTRRKDSDTPEANKTTFGFNEHKKWHATSPGARSTNRTTCDLVVNANVRADSPESKTTFSQLERGSQVNEVSASIKRGISPPLKVSEAFTCWVMPKRGSSGSFKSRPVGSRLRHSLLFDIEPPCL